MRMASREGKQRLAVDVDGQRRPGPVRRLAREGVDVGNGLRRYRQQSRPAVRASAAPTGSTNEKRSRLEGDTPDGATIR